MSCDSAPPTPCDLATPTSCCNYTPACPQCGNNSNRPDSVQAFFANTLLSTNGFTACNSSPWAPGTVSLSFLGTGTVCRYQYGIVADNQRYAYTEWQSDHWIILVATTGSTYAISTVWYQWDGPSTPCDPRGVYTNPYTDSLCVPESPSVPASTVIVA